MDDMLLLIFILLEISIAFNLLQLKKLKNLKSNLEKIRASVEITSDEMAAIRDRMEKIKKNLRSQLILR